MPEIVVPTAHDLMNDINHSIPNCVSPLGASKLFIHVLHLLKAQSLI